MLLLTMIIDDATYGLDAQRVIEVIPLVQLRQVPRVDPCIRGIFNYRGTPVPVVDLCTFFNKQPCRKNLGSRIILIQIQMSDSSHKIVGLLAEHVTEVIKCHSKDFTSNGINASNAQFLHSIYQHDSGMIQIINAEKVIPDSITQQFSSQEFS